MENHDHPLPEVMQHIKENLIQMFAFFSTSMFQGNQTFVPLSMLTSYSLLNSQYSISLI